MASPEEMLFLLPETLPYNPKKQYMIDHSGMVTKRTYQILVAVFTTIATIAALTRLAIHLKYRRKLFVDDYLVLFANACLLVQTGILYKYCPMIYVISVVLTDPMGFTYFTRGEMLSLAGMLKWSNIFVCFAWTVNYTIKLSFLVFFWTLVRDVSVRLTRYWWFVLCFVGLSWVFNMIENFIICGANNSRKCYPSPLYMVEMTAATSVADILSDLMIISIPIIILNKSQMRLAQKMRILPFLCLNVFMATFCLIRIAGKYTDPHGTMQVHVEWTTLTLHMESSVAVLMGGVTAFRTLFASRIRERGHQQDPEFRTMGTGLYYRLRKLFNRGNSSRTLEVQQTENDKSMLSRVKVGGTLSGLRTFIRRHKREPGQTTMQSEGASWDDSMGGSVYNYHDFKREEKKAMGSDGGPSLQSKGTGGTMSTEAPSLPERPSPVLQTHNMV